MMGLTGREKILPLLGMQVLYMFPMNSEKRLDGILKEGRDFSRSFGTDTAAMILNESMAKFMGLKNPVGETLRWMGKPYQIVGIVKDMLMENPYEPVFRTVFVMATVCATYCQHADQSADECARSDCQNGTRI